MRCEKMFKKSGVLIPSHSNIAHIHGKGNLFKNINPKMKLYCPAFHAFPVSKMFEL